MTAIYWPPKCILDTGDYLKLFQSLGGHFTTGGDFNAKHTYWGSRPIMTKGRYMYEAIKLAKCENQSTGNQLTGPQT